MAVDNYKSSFDKHLLMGFYVNTGFYFTWVFQPGVELLVYMVVVLLKVFLMKRSRVENSSDHLFKMKALSSSESHCTQAECLP